MRPEGRVMQPEGRGVRPKGPVMRSLGPQARPLGPVLRPAGPATRLRGPASRLRGRTPCPEGPPSPSQWPAPCPSGPAPRVCRPPTGGARAQKGRSLLAGRNRLAKWRLWGRSGPPRRVPLSIRRRDFRWSWGSWAGSSEGDWVGEAISRSQGAVLRR